MGKIRSSPRKTTSVNPYRPSSTKRMVTSLALNKATKALTSVAIDSSTQRGNIKVVVRVRPINNRETTANSRTVVYAVDSHMVVFDPPDDETPEFYYKGVRQTYQQKTRNKNIRFAFDNVYGPKSTNTEVFDDVIIPMLDTLLSGFNCSVFAYGATGSGKTHTMIGPKDSPGLTFQTVMELYKRLDEMDKDYETEVAVSYLEVYNETVKDLLQNSGVDLQIREDSNGVVVSNLTTHKPKDSAELLHLLALGNSVRSQHPTDHNDESSRSHAVFQVYINLRSRFTELTNKYRSAKLVMVDLAGSEKGAATGCQGQRFREGSSINRSLLSLGNCINALAGGKKHIPYRDSKLTRILKDSLGGNCKTVMIANVSPSSLSYDDSYNTLKYADRAKRITFQVKKNTMSVSACLTQYTKVVEEMTHKIKQLEDERAEYQKNCRCNNIKVDAFTETNFEPTANPIPDPVVTPSNNTGPTVPNRIINRLDELTKKKLETIHILCDASSAASTIATRIGVKERRINSIKRLKSSGEEKNTFKIKKQLEPLQMRHEEALSKKAKAHKALQQIETEINEIQSECANIDDSNYVPMKFADYVELQNLKIEKQKADLLKKSYQGIGTIYLDEWQKGENLLGRAVEFSSAQYLMNKHYKNNTKQMDVDYEGLVANLCGTKVQWSGDMDTDKSSSIPYLKKFLDDAALLEDDSEEDTAITPPKAPSTYFASRPRTPPRPAGFKMSEVDDEESADGIPSSSAPQTSTLDITYILGNTEENNTVMPMNEDTDHADATNIAFVKTATDDENANTTITLDEPTCANFEATKYFPISQMIPPIFTFPVNANDQ